MKQKARIKMAQSDKQETHKPKGNPEFQRAIDEVLELGGSKKEQDSLKLRQGSREAQDFQAKEIITLLSRWRDREDDLEDDVLAQVAWFCITQIEIDRKAKEEEGKEQEKKAKEAQESADKAINKTGDTQPNEERRQEAAKRASV